MKEKDEEWLAKFHHFKDEHTRALSEKDRRLDALQVKFNADLGNMCDIKDKEIDQLQNAVTQTYKEM